MRFKKSSRSDLALESPHSWTNRPWNGEIREDAAENPCFVHWIPYPQILLTFERGQIGETVRAPRESNTVPLRIRNARRHVINSLKKKRKTRYESEPPTLNSSIDRSKLSIRVSRNYEKINKRRVRKKKEKERSIAGTREREREREKWRKM